MARFETLHRVRTAASEYFNEVFERVPDDARGFREIRRVPGFAEAWIDERFSAAFLGHGSAVVCGRA
jgi:hypothetical protein